MTEEIRKGLEGVVVAESSLSYIDGDAGRLVYRGYDIEDLAREASYEEVLYLLWEGELPDAESLATFTDTMARHRTVDESVIDALRGLANAGERPMAALRTGVSALSAFDDVETAMADREAAKRAGLRITAQLPTVLAAFERLRDGKDPVSPREDLGHAANFLYMRDDEEPSAVAAETFDMALTLHADHGLNASTFTAMVVASTMADMYNAVTAGIGALSGPLHGGANQDVMELLLEIAADDRDPVEYVAERMEESDWRMPGWGHRVYNVKDPRAVILQERSRQLGEASGDRTWYEMTTAIESYLTDELGLPDKGIAPNVDFFSGSVYHQLGIPADLYTPIFAMARSGGWIAHVLEYQADNRLIRPRARYTGEQEADWLPIENR